MKKFILLGLAPLFYSCAVFNLREPKFTMGMAEKDFLAQNKTEMISASENGPRVYRTYHEVTGFKYFVFRDNKLVRFEKDYNPEPNRYY